MPSRRLRRRGGPRAVVAVVAVAALLTACTGDGGGPGGDDDPGPSTSPSSADPDARASSDLPDVAVVLPARNARPFAEIEVQRGFVDEVATEVRAAGWVDEVRVVLPDRFSTVGDVLAVLADEGYDLVCALGPGAARGVREVAEQFPATRFCATPGRLPEVAPNTLVFDLRVEEAAFLAGIAARFAAPTVAPEQGREPALVLGDATQVARLRPPFDEGFLAVRDEQSTTAALVATDVEAARAAAAAQYEAGAFVVYTSAGRAEAGVVAAAREAGALVIGWSPWVGPLVDDDGVLADVDDATPSPTADAGPGGAPWNLLQFREVLATALRDAVAELESGWVGGNRSLGLSNGAIALVPGTSPVWPRVRAQVLDTRDAIIRGDITVAPG